MLWHPSTGNDDSWGNLAPRAAFADGPVADHPEPVTAERRIVAAEPDGGDLDTVGHVDRLAP